MNLEQVKENLSVSYERINNMKTAISRVESCKAVLLVRRDEVLADVKQVMNELAQQLFSLQMVMEAAVENIVEERVKFLDAKKQDILNANSYLVEVCMEADRLLKGRNDDLLGRACQRIFSKFERAWQQLDLAGRIDRRSVASFALTSNIQKLTSSTYVAKLQQLDQYKQVLDEQEFWINEPVDNLSAEVSNASSLSAWQQSGEAGGRNAGRRSTAEVAHSPRRSPGLSPPLLVREPVPAGPESAAPKTNLSHSSLSNQSLDTIYEVPEPSVAGRMTSKKQCEPQARNTDVPAGNRRLPSVVRIREVDLTAEFPEKTKPVERKGGTTLAPAKHTGFCNEEWLEVDTVNVRSSFSQENTDSSLLPDSRAVSCRGQVPAASMQSDLEFWNVDSCAEPASMESECSMMSVDQLHSSASSKPRKSSSDTADMCDASQSNTNQQGQHIVQCKDEEDFVWESDEEEVSARKSQGSAGESDTGTSAPGSKDGSESSVKGHKPTREAQSSRNVALSTSHRQASDESPPSGQVSKQLDDDDHGSCPTFTSAEATQQPHLSRGESSARAAPDISIIVGKSGTTEQDNQVSETEIDRVPDDLKSSTDSGFKTVEEADSFVKQKVKEEENNEAKGWSTRTTWRRSPMPTDQQEKQKSPESSPRSAAHSQSRPAAAKDSSLVHAKGTSGDSKDVPVSTPSVPPGDICERSTEVPVLKPSKTLRTKKLDISRMLEEGRDGICEVPAKLVERISGDLSFPIGIATNSIGDVIVADTRNNVVKVFRSGVLINTLENKLQRPSAVVVNDKDEIFVKDDYSIMHFDPNGNCIESFGRKFMHMPYGLAMTSDGRMVVIDAMYQDPRILVFTQDGQMTAYRYDPIVEAPPESKCRFLAVYGDEVLTSDLGCSCLYLTSVTGELYKVLSKYGHGPGQLREPAGITVDSAGNWIVADSKNNRIQVFAPNGYFMCKLRLSDCIRRPSGIHLSRDGLLYVINYLDGVINVFKIGVE